MTCTHGSAAYMFAHDVEADEHAWPGDDETECDCRPVAVCVICDLERIRTHGYLALCSTELDALRACADGAVVN